MASAIESSQREDGRGARSPRGKSEENSVMFALGELAKLESQRVAEERDKSARRAEQARLEHEREAQALAEAERRANERERETRARIEAEARLRIEAEIAQDARIHALKAQLERVAAERHEMQRTALDAGRAPAPSASARAWPLAFGLASVVAAALAGLVVMQAQTAPRIVEVERQVVVTVPQASPAASPTLAAEAPRVATPVAPEVAPAPPAPRGRTRAARTRVTPIVERHDDLDFGDGDDVIGGIERERAH